MSKAHKEIVERTRRVAQDAAVATVWAQWGRLGFLASGGQSQAGDALLDPEVLLVLTLDAVRWEPRLDQALDWWAVCGAGLLSLPRIDSVLQEVPVNLERELGRFAARVWGAKNASGSWKRRARDAGFKEEPPPARLKGTTSPRLLRPEAVMLRVRSFSTLGAKADVLSYLIAQREYPSTVALIAKALGYAERAIRLAASDLEAAGLITSQRKKVARQGRDPIRYVFRSGTLDLGEVPPWRFWPQIAGFILGAARWGEKLRASTPFLLANEARQLDLRRKDFWIEHALPARYSIADPVEHPGPAYLRPFSETVEAVAEWLADGLPMGPLPP
ncbi:MAG: hypothetical protein Rubg2KO_30150 [Rubricoccaceae bacterium]